MNAVIEVEDHLTIPEILSSVRHLGCDFVVHNGEPGFKGDIKALPKSLRKEISRQYSEVLKYVQWKSMTAGTLADFARSDRVLRFYSELVGEPVVFAGERAVLQNVTDVVYQGDELLLLAGISSTAAEIIHEIRRTIPGKLSAEDLGKHAPQQISLFEAA
jgi:hypothetical protein